MLSRRGFVAGAAAALYGAGDGHAQFQQCTAFDWNGIQQCTVGRPSFSVRSAQQACQNWCWAACVQSIFNTHGYNVSQRAIIERLYGGSLPCVSATGQQLASLTNGWWDVGNFRFRVRSEQLLNLDMGIWTQNIPTRVDAELRSGRPLLNGSLGHATMLTAMTYLRDHTGRFSISQLIVRDPWPFSPHLRYLSAQEVASTRFLLAVRVQ